jgi:SAM-dependent methyltransferase
MSFYDVWVRWKDKGVRSFRQRGVVGTLKLALARANEDLSCRWRHYRNELFDRRFEVDTAGTLILPELQSDPLFKYGNAYAPTPRSLFFRMLRKLEVDYSKFLFIDFGCGKGKALLLAGDMPFKQIIGIEISSKLIRVAEENLKTYRSRTRQRDVFQLFCMDAGEYPIPQEPAIYYFANPFQAEVMRKVLENIRRSHAAMPREGYIVYLDPVLQALLDGCGYLAPVKKAALYSIWKVPASPCPTSG